MANKEKQSQDKAITLEVVDISQVVALMDADLKERVEKLTATLDMAKERITKLERLVDDFQGSPVGKMKRNLASAMEFIRYVAGMDQAFYKRPNDWHIGLQMTSRAQEFLSHYSEQ